MEIEEIKNDTVDKESDFSDIPDYVFNVLFNDFNDGYFDTSFEDEDPEAFKVLSNIGTRYNDPELYFDAIEKYDAYIGRADKYYGHKLGRKFAKRNNIPMKGYPKRPKPGGKAKKMVESGIILRTTKAYEPLDDNSIMEVDAKRFPSRGENAVYDYPYLSRETKRAIRKEIRKDFNTVKTTASQYSVDTDIVMNITRPTYPQSQYDNPISRVKKLDMLSIKEHRELYDANVINEELESILSKEQILEEAGIIRTQYDMSAQSNYTLGMATSLLVAKKLDEAGQIPFRREAIETMSDSRKYVYMNNVGAQSVMTDREFKKYKKQSKKEMKKYRKQVENHRRSSNRALSSMLMSKSRANAIRLEEDD